MRFYLLITIYCISLLACESSNEVKRPEPKKEFAHESLPAQKPFPQGQIFSGCIKPNHLSQGNLNSDVVNYYKTWLNSYVYESNGTTPGGGYYVRMKGTGGDGSEITTSEAHGYGMIIFALMAGSDDSSQKYFDGFLNMYEEHRSTGNSNCMSWVIHETEQKQYDKGSATDGDMDIAYALLLADKQWGSDGVIDYLEKAKTLITEGLKVSCLSSLSHRTLLGDWDKDHYSTRSSDWMTGHMRAFQSTTKDNVWITATDEVYSLINEITHSHSSQTGLMPDFVIGQTPKPASEFFLNEYKETDEYCWNACRYPWRIASDYAHFGTVDAKKAMQRLLDFIVDETNAEPNAIKAGYHLDGKPLNAYSSAAFTAPLVTASIVDAKYQGFLNKGWDVIKVGQESYYGDTITLLNMLLISGNWWNPVD